jgi:hypothetical protein
MGPSRVMTNALGGGKIKVQQGTACPSETLGGLSKITPVFLLSSLLSSTCLPTISKQQ